VKTTKYKYSVMVLECSESFVVCIYQRRRTSDLYLYSSTFARLPT